MGKRYDQSNLDEGRVYWVHASTPRVVAEESRAGTQVGTEAVTRRNEVSWLITGSLAAGSLAFSTAQEDLVQPTVGGALLQQ